MPVRQKHHTMYTYEISRYTDVFTAHSHICEIIVHMGMILLTNLALTDNREEWRKHYEWLSIIFFVFVPNLKWGKKN